jgi:dihydroflavonol-4-reductase
MLVTVTGANGFIGHHLVRDQLAQGREVRAVDTMMSRLQALQTHPAVELIQADIRDVDRMRQTVTGAAIVFHLASAHLSVALAEDEYWHINRDGSRALVQVCHQAGVKRFVHCSSVGIYGNVSNPPANEDSVCHPDIVYEQSKLAGETAVRHYARDTGFPVVIVRPVWVYGPGCPRTEKLLRAIGNKRFWLVGNGHTLLHCMYITDALAAFELCAQHPKAPGGVFVVGDHKAVTIRQLIEQMAAVCGVAPPRWSIPIWVLKPVCAFVERAYGLLGKEPPISQRSLKFFTNNTSFDISRAQRELGFAPKITLQEGLRFTYEAVSGHAISGSDLT